MGKTFLVTYDVANGDSADYEAIDTALEKRGTIHARQGSARWLKESSSSAAAIRDAVVGAVKPKEASVWVLQALPAADTAFT